MSDADKRHVLSKVASRSAGEAGNTAVLSLAKEAVQKKTG